MTNAMEGPSGSFFLEDLALARGYPPLPNRTYELDPSDVLEPAVFAQAVAAARLARAKQAVEDEVVPSKAGLQSLGFFRRVAESTVEEVDAPAEQATEAKADPALVIKQVWHLKGRCGNKYVASRSMAPLTCPSTPCIAFRSRNRRLLVFRRRKGGPGSGRQRSKRARSKYASARRGAPAWRPWSGSSRPRRARRLPRSARPRPTLLDWRRSKKKSTVSFWT